MVTGLSKKRADFGGVQTTDPAGCFYMIHYLPSRCLYNSQERDTVLPRHAIAWGGSARE